MLLRRFRQSPQKSNRAKLLKRTVCGNLADNHGFWDKLYLAPEGRTRHAAPEQIATATQATWTILQRKWRTVSGGLDLILDEDHPLGFWRKVMLELHRIDLPTRP